MAATRGVIQHRARFAIPFRQRVGDPANVVKVAVNVQWTLGPKDIADDDRFVGIYRRSRQHCANGETDNFTCPHETQRSEVRGHSSAFRRVLSCHWSHVTHHYPLSWRSYSAASKWPFDSPMRPSLSIFQSS